ncbi:N-6 DNA methylase [Planococcus lenghuensis]|uniref:site-specific DNA-methyltransferase (adenine-specific) n=1 Tax=Planococcus lenghuensis TaxID=2213202 RepID=A0A1Q2KVU8_9BACL|nr:N-6 DNA methylase [Planococcus lenghuensis]AQQ52345.1 hypothetical protein B0X71_03945 [Planococcus lenghuensis]
MHNEKALWTLLGQLRGSFSFDDALELSAVGSLFGLLARRGELDFDALLSSEKSIKDTLVAAEQEHSCLQGISSGLNIINRAASVESIRFLCDFNTLRNDIEDYDDWFEEVLELISRRSRSKGEHSSPETINTAALSILKPGSGTFYDGAAGLGGGFIEACRQAGDTELVLYGQELDPRAWALAKIRLFLHGIGNVTLKQGNVLTDPAFTDDNHVRQFDYVFMDAPFGLTLPHAETLEQDPYSRFLYGVPSRRSTDLAFLSHALASLNNRGRGIAVTADGALYRGGADAAIRKNILASDMIEAVIALPARLYETAVLPVNLIVFNKNKGADRKGCILFINAGDRAAEGQRSRRVMTAEEIRRITEVMESGTDVPGFSKWIGTEEVKEGNLLPSRYLVASEAVIAGIGTVRVFPEQLDQVKRVPLKERAEFFSGFNVVSRNKESDQGKYRIVKISDVQDGRLNLENVTRYAIDNNAKVEKYQLAAGDVILSIRGQALKSAVIPENSGDLLLSQNFVGIRCGPRLHPEFLKVYLDSPLGQFLLTSKLSGTTVPTLSRKDVEALEVPDVPIGDQVKVIRSYSSKKADIERQMKELERQRQEVNREIYRQMGIGDAFGLTN